MSETHLVHQRPRIHCSGCGNPLIYPHSGEVNSEKIASGQAVLGECTKCSVAVEVPAHLFIASDHVSVSKTVARKWGIPRAKLSTSQREALKLTDDQLKALGINIE